MMGLKLNYVSKKGPMWGIYNMRQRTRSLLAWRLVIAKPLPMLAYH